MIECPFCHKEFAGDYSLWQHKRGIHGFGHGQPVYIPNQPEKEREEQPCP